MLHASRITLHTYVLKDCLKALRSSKAKYVPKKHMKIDFKTMNYLKLWLQFLNIFYAKDAKIGPLLEGNQNKNFLRQIGLSRAFLPPVSHGEKRGKFQFAVEIAHKAVVLILISL